MLTFALKPSAVYCIRCRRKFESLGTEQTCDECLAEFVIYAPLLANYPLTIPYTETIEHITNEEGERVTRYYGFTVPIDYRNVQQFKVIIGNPNTWVAIVLKDQAVLDVLRENYPDLPDLLSLSLSTDQIELNGVGDFLIEIKFGTTIQYPRQN